MSDSLNIDWLTPFLPKLRCPNTHEAMRVATADEARRFGAAEGPALVNQSATHLYPVIAGIPHLLPTSAIVAQ